jgi:glycosyltransferase involved in cell wall biosynthesis
MVGPEGLDRFCRALSVSKLLFRPQLDPRVPVELHYYTLPSKLGETEIETIEPRTRDEFLEATASANLVVAPRNAEGVGLTFLEAMARGCCVFGYDAPTMNEYISDGNNGVLFRLRESRLRSAARRVRRRPINAVDVDQPWRRLSRTDPHGFGDQARADHVAGRRRWIESVPAYGRFILDW